MSYSYTHTRRLFKDIADKIQAELPAVIAASTIKYIFDCYDNWQRFQRTKQQQVDKPSTMMRQGVMQSLFFAMGEEQWSHLSPEDVYMSVEELRVDDVTKKGVSVSGELYDAASVDAEYLQERNVTAFHRIMEEIKLLPVVPAPKIGEAGLPGTERFRNGYEKTEFIDLPMRMDLDLSRKDVNQMVIQDKMRQAGDKTSVICVDGLPLGQMYRFIHKEALGNGVAVRVKGALGPFHWVWHHMEATVKLVWDLGYETLAKLLLRSKVLREVVGAVFEVQEDFLKVVYKGMYRAAIRAWLKNTVVDSTASVQELWESFLAYMKTVCEQKEFTRFWWEQFLSKYAMEFFMFREAVRTSDAHAIEVVARQALALFKFTHKHKYVGLTANQLIDILTSSKQFVECLRCNRMVSMNGNIHHNQGTDKKVEDDNGWCKCMTDADCSNEWLETMTAIRGPLKGAHCKVRIALGIGNRKHFDPKMKTDIHMIDAESTQSTMFENDGKPMLLCDQFSKDVDRETSIPAAEKYLNVVGATQEAVEKTVFTQVGLRQEAKLIIAATAIKKREAITVGESPVAIRELTAQVTPPPSS